MFCSKNTSPLGGTFPQTESLFTVCSQATLDPDPVRNQLFPILCSEQDVSTRVSCFIRVGVNFPFQSTWLPGENNVLEAQEQFWVFCLVVWSFQRATFPKFGWGLLKLAFCGGWMGDRLCFRLYACTSTRIFSPCNLSEDYLDFCRNILSS